MIINKRNTMKKITTIFLAILFLSLMDVHAQEKSFEEKVKILSDRIEKITANERLTLKEGIKDINSRLEANEISDKEAQELKRIIAKKSALNIEQRVSAIEKQLQDLIQNKVNNEIFTEDNRKRFRIGGFDVDYDDNYRKRLRKRNYNRRTTSSTIVAFGLNNLITDGSLSSIDDSEFNFWQSRFFELGVNHKTRVFKNSSLLYVNYGFSVMYNTLRPKQDQYFVVDDNATALQTHTMDLDKSKFKNVQLVVPVMLELDFSKPKSSNKDNNIRYRTNKSVRIGAGGFVGVNLKTKQILKYEENDIKVKDRQKGDFNVNNFVYGLSTFIGYKDTSFYVKYNLNELFKNSTLEPLDYINLIADAW